jgi:hypothetical protein
MAGRDVVTAADLDAIGEAIGRRPPTPLIETTADLIAAFEITQTLLSLALTRLQAATVEIQRLRARQAEMAPRRAA